MAFFRRVKKTASRRRPAAAETELQWLQTQVGRYKGKIFAVGLLSLTGTIMALFPAWPPNISSTRSRATARICCGAPWHHGRHAAGKPCSARRFLPGGARVHVDVKNEMQHVTYRHVLRAGWEALEPYRSGDLLSRLNSDVNVVSDGIIGFFPSLATSSVKFAGAFASCCTMTPRWRLSPFWAFPSHWGCPG